MLVVIGFLAVVMCGLACLELSFRVRPDNVDVYVKDTLVAIGTMLVVSMAVIVPVAYLYGRLTPPMTEAEREAALERSMRDLDAWASFTIGTHGVTVAVGACILAMFLVIVLIRSLVR